MRDQLEVLSVFLRRSARRPVLLPPAFLPKPTPAGRGIQLDLAYPGRAPEQRQARGRVARFRCGHERDAEDRIV